jgi:hypothetical protein
MSSIFDHLTITAASLEEGSDYVRDALGVELQPGGKHAAMGTHNLLLSLGNSRFLEVIAVDPDAPPPTRPRWFGLDSMGPRSQPRLTGWVVRTRRIHKCLEGFGSLFGTIEAVTRGACSWLITVPKDGSLPVEGAAPSLVQWSGSHPAQSLADSGCELLKLIVCHREPRYLSAILAGIDFESRDLVRLGKGRGPVLTAVISTPNGVRVLSAV